MAHTPPGGRIRVSVQERDDGATLTVSDTGSGIPADELPHVWERFRRVDPARGRDTGGAGLGLAIVRQFVEAMGGRVEATSHPDRGSTFAVWLPRSASGS